MARKRPFRCRLGWHIHLKLMNVALPGKQNAWRCLDCGDVIVR